MKKELIKAVIFSTRPVNQALLKWASQFDFQVISVPFGDPQMIACARNRACKEFLDGEHKYLLLLDDDAWPVKETNPIITSSLPVCGCAAVSRHGGVAHPGRHEIGAHCLRISKAALLTMKDSALFDESKGWFCFEFADCGSELVNCEDGYFSRLADACGYRPIKVGVIGHVLPMVVVPSGDGIRADFPERMEDAKLDTE